MPSSFCWFRNFTSPICTPDLRDAFPNDIGPDDKAPDALDVYRRVLAAQLDGSVTVCSMGALSNLAELWRREPALVRAKIRRVVIDEKGFSRWVADAASPQVMVTRVCVPELLARQIEALMVAPPTNPTTKESP